MDLKSLQGPVYPGIARENNYFAVLERSWAYLREKANPYEDLVRDHCFQDLGSNIESLKEMNYPVREGVDTSHHFNVVQEKIVNLRNLTGRIYNFTAHFLKGLFNNFQLRNADF